MRQSTVVVPTERIVYEVSEYAVLIGGVLELFTCCFICISCLFKKSKEFRTGFYTILCVGFCIDAVWTIVYFIYRYTPAKKFLSNIAPDIQMFAILVIGPWVFILSINRYIAMALPKKYDIYFSYKKTLAYGGIILAVGIFYVACRHLEFDELFLNKFGQNLTTVFCIFAFAYALESVRSQKRCEWRRQIEDRKLLYLTLTITTFQLIANILSAYIITVDTVRT